MKRILLILERDNMYRDSHLIKPLVAAVASKLESIKGEQYEVIWYNPLGLGGFGPLDPNDRLGSWPHSLRWLIKFFLLLIHPRHIRHYLSMRYFREKTINGRAKNLRHAIVALQKQYGGQISVSILSRSAGGRVASLIADSLSPYIASIVCLGYPFKHPDRSVEPVRYIHLAKLMTPMLIVQGTRDEYGGKGVERAYAFSPSVALRFFETGHDFYLSPLDNEVLTSQVANFISTHR